MKTTKTTNTPRGQPRCRVDGVCDDDPRCSDCKPVGGDHVPNTPLYDRWWHEITTQDEGEAHLIYRMPRTLASLLEFEEWLALVMGKVRRIVEAGGR